MCDYRWRALVARQRFVIYPSSMLRAFCLTALLVTSLLACGETTTSTYCRYDSDCPETGERFCVLGVCRAEECTSDRDCDDGDTCTEGICES